MTTFLILFLLQTFFVYEKVECLDLFSEIQLCKAKDPNLNECVKQAGQKLIPLLADGMKEWNISPLDPMLTPSVTFKDTNKDRDITMTYTNLIQTGFAGVIIENADIDLQHGVMNFKLKYPRFYFGGDYSTKGRLFEFTVEGNGKANITIWNCFSSLVIKFHVSNDHIKFYSVILGFSFDDIYLDYTNISINGDKELSESASAFINENAREIINGFKPQLEEFYGKIVGELLQIIFDKVPYSVLFKNE